MREHDEDTGSEQLNGANYLVGYRRPPLHTRFKPGQSDNPSGRAKGSQNLRTLFQKIMKEEVSLREGSVTKKISKAEAILRGLVLGAMKGDSRSQMTLFKLAEQTGQFDQDREPLTAITRIIVNRFGETGDEPASETERVPAISHLNRD